MKSTTSTPKDTQAINPDTKVQGEGDYEAARRYDESARSFAQSGKVEPAARNAKPRDEKEANDIERAEEVGKSRSKGEDPGDAR